MTNQPVASVTTDETAQAMESPQPGDHFTEMYSFHVVVVAVDGDFVITAEGNGKFSENAKFHRQTLDEFRSYFGYSDIPGYWIRLYRRGINVDGWLDGATLVTRTSSRTAPSVAVQRLINLVRKRMCHLPACTHAEINAAIAEVEKGGLL